MSPELKKRMIAIDAFFEMRQAKPLPPEFYLIALAGEVGEASNLYKKMMRGDQIPNFEYELGLELADVRIYLEHFARKMGIDLDAATEEKIAICEKRWGIEWRS